MKHELISKTQSLGISDRVKFLGYREDVAELMKAFDVGVVPSRQEAFGITAIEFMSMKIPLVSSDVYGLAEIVENMRNALVPSENKPDYIAECIERIISDSQLRFQLKEKGSETASNFSIHTCVEAVENIYNDLMN